MLRVSQETGQNFGSPSTSIAPLLPERSCKVHGFTAQHTMVQYKYPQTFER